MKTPLSIIRNYGEILKEEKDDEKRTQFTQNIIDEADGTWGNCNLHCLDMDWRVQENEWKDASKILSIY